MILVVLIISLVINVTMGIVLKRYIKRLLQFDSLFNIINEDMEMNLEYLNDMLSNHVSTNAPEIIALDENLKLMRDRFISVTQTINNLHIEDNTTK